MLRDLRERVKSMPVLGRSLYSAYLTMFKKEGERLTIESGPLAGMVWVRFMRTFNPQYAAGTYEPQIQQALVNHLKSGMVFYDIGANGGFFSLLGAKLVGPSGAVVSYEPHPETARLCRAQIHANNLSNVTVVQSAVSDKSGSAHFADDVCSEMASLDGAAGATRTVIVSLTTLDEEIQRHPAPDVLKIDIEGAEISALRQASALIKEKQPMLLVEVHSDQLASLYDDLMDSYRYDTFDMENRKISVFKSKQRFVISRPARVRS